MGDYGLVCCAFGADLSEAVVVQYLGPHNIALFSVGSSFDVEYTINPRNYLRDCLSYCKSQATTDMWLLTMGSGFRARGCRCTWGLGFLMNLPTWDDQIT